ncbi:3-hydroxyacyl-CoA dehydrogenase [Sphingopyxis lindanitolerans]|uniref:3-hydroxyacyl-CoA dehydrogenase n=1 Tax=Sphingopyxis lindanitolerans TaxID=2054227 RepID=UPI0018D59009|nr:3-hydroxyacyl-CoA dehydrogenase [Sphingopyxis lindanitolerans]
MNSAVLPYKVAIVGCGFVGLSWAIVFARAGHEVRLHDPVPAVLDDALARLADTLDRLAMDGMAERPTNDVLANVTVAASLQDAVSGAGYVQESSPERLDVKQALFRELDNLAPETAILASSSSGLTTNSVCGDLPGRSRCLVAHPANPPHLLPAVEIVPAPFTELGSIDRASEIMRGVGQVPVVIKEIDGFVMNRLQAALAREALDLVESGIAGPEAVDAIMRGSLGLRWSFMGPFETMDLNAPGGFADYAERYGPGFARLAGAVAWPEAAVGRVDDAMRRQMPIDRLEEKRVWRDRQLASLSKLRSYQKQ